MQDLVYRFDQLSPRAKEKARRSASDRLWRDASIDGLREEWVERLRALGYSQPRILYSLGYCQGDGACFTAHVDLHKLVERAGLGLGTDLERALGKYTAEQMEEVLNGGYATMEHRGNYCHFRSVETGVTLERSVDGVDEEDIARLEQELGEFLESEHERLAKEFEAEGYADLEHQSGSEAVEHYLSEQEFDEEGNEV